MVMMSPTLPQGRTLFRRIRTAGGVVNGHCAGCGGMGASIEAVLPEDLFEDAAL